MVTEMVQTENHKFGFSLLALKLPLIWSLGSDRLSRDDDIPSMEKLNSQLAISRNHGFVVVFQLKSGTIMEAGSERFLEPNGRLNE